MINEAFYNSDGEMLIVAQMGSLRIITEMGRIHVRPDEIVVIPQGVRFLVEVDGPSRGYICELMGARYVLPNLGPIGANGLASVRDFEYPVAWFDAEGDDKEFQVVTKYQNEIFSHKQNHTPFDVVAWWGNFAPYS